MAMIYDADTEQVREETEDPRAMLRPAEVPSSSASSAAHSNTIH